MSSSPWKPGLPIHANISNASLRSTCAGPTMEGASYQVISPGHGMELPYGRLARACLFSFTHALLDNWDQLTSQPKVQSCLMGFELPCRLAFGCPCTHLPQWKVCGPLGSRTSWMPNNTRRRMSEFFRECFHWVLIFVILYNLRVNNTKELNI